MAAPRTYDEKLATIVRDRTLDLQPLNVLEPVPEDFMYLGVRIPANV